MKQTEPTVFVVDDDKSVRVALSRLIRSTGMNVETFSTAHEFLSRKSHDGPSCLVLDVKMPGLNGLDLQQELADTLSSVEAAGVTASQDAMRGLLEKVAGATNVLCRGIDSLEEAIGAEDSGAMIEAMGTAREGADELEGLLPDDIWPLPSYAEMLFML